MRVGEPWPDLQCRGMAATPKAKPRGPWTPEEVARNERARMAQVTHDRARGVGPNIEEAAALARFVNRFTAAFRDARRA
jgi:hypothetical protein